MYQSEQSRNIQNLIRDKNHTSIVQSRRGNDFFAVADEREGNQIAVKFINAVGEQKAIHYHDIISPMDFNGDTEIRLSTTRIAIVINGKNLANLFDHIIQHHVKWLKEPDSQFSNIEEGEVVITSLRFESLQ